MTMQRNSACKICGCTETYLIDGYYYCAECGTQDTNVRETLVEFTSFDNTNAIGARKKITSAPEANKTEMSTDWYKWHSVNFLLQGLANEVIECGAEPTFKTKLLWVWTRYMKKYQNKADFGLEEDKQANAEDDNPAMNEENDSSDEDEEQNKFRKHFRKSVRHIKIMSMCLVMSFLYVALNLDRSHIQLTHLIRFIKDGRISIIGWRKHVPNELTPARLSCCLFFHIAWLRYSYMTIRYISLQIFKELDLGSPIMPDLRPIIEDYVRELCLPNDMIPLVHSLMFYRSFEYLNTHLHATKTMPSYEMYVMAHILCALKICFGIDGNYESKLSDAVDKINEIEQHPRSYNSEPTRRLFSFHEWSKYILFRRSQLWAHSLLLGAPNYRDMNDYVAFEQQTEKPDFKKSLKDEIERNILNKMPESEVNVISMSEFPPTTTPYYIYTRMIHDHMQDPIVKKMLSEDFTQYSLNYILEDMFLVDPESDSPQNIVTGVDPCDFCQQNTSFVMGGAKDLKQNARYDYKMIYVKDCDNHNWMTSQRPTLEHITSTKEDEENDLANSIDNVSKNDTDINSVTTVDINDLTTIHEDIDSKDFVSNLIGNNKYIEKNDKVFDLNNIPDDDKLLHEDSKYDAASDINSVTTVDINEFTTITETKINGDTDSKVNLSNLNYSDNITEDSKVFDLNSTSDIQMDTDSDQLNKEEDLKIREEDEDVNIFDDYFEKFDAKTKKEDELDDNELEHNEQQPKPVQNNSMYVDDYSPERQEYYAGRESEESSDDSIHLNPETLDRNAAIKELVIHACNKYKISIPGKYIHRPKSNYKLIRKPVNRAKRRATEAIAQEIKSFIADYNSKIQEDIFLQMSTMVQSAISEFNQSRIETPMEIDEPLAANNNNDGNVDEPNDATLEANTISDSQMDVEIATEDYKLFDEESDGETKAEDLLPKKNPKFDERTHDISQLYLKPVVDADVPEMKLNHRLINIIDQKIEDEKIDKPPSSPEPNEQSDPEDNLPLNVLQEMKLILKSLKESRPLRARVDKRPSLINLSVPVSPYMYWFRRYVTNTNKGLLLSVKNKHFVTEMRNMPHNFRTVLQECADVLGYPPYNLYMSLQRVETCIYDSCVRNKNVHMPWYSRCQRSPQLCTY